MTKIKNEGRDNVSFPVPYDSVDFNHQVWLAPGEEVELTAEQAAAPSVMELISKGAIEASAGAVLARTLRNVSDSNQSFPVPLKSVGIRKMVWLAPGEEVELTDEQADSPAVRRLVEEGVVSDGDPQIPEGSSFGVSLDKDAYAISGAGTANVKATVTPVDGELSVEDKAGWGIVSKSGKLDCTGTTWTVAGVCTLKVKRNDGASLDSFTENLYIVKDGERYAQAKVTVTANVTVTTDQANKLTTDGVNHVTAVKVNGVEVDQAECSIASKDGAAAVHKGDVWEITPMRAGKAEFSIEIGGKMAEFAITFYAPACKIGGNFYKTVAAALKEAKSGDTVVIDNDITESVSFGGQTPREKGFTLTIDLNGHEWKAANNPYALRVDYGTVTVKDSIGGGKVAYGTDYAFMVSHLAGDYESVLVLESGEFTGKTSVVQCGTPGGTGSNKKYYGGELVVKGGTFKTVPDEGETYDANGNFKYTLNMLDMVASAYPGGIYSESKISVEGGRFEKFDPADCAAEGEHTSFVAEGRTSTKDGDWYIVA